MTDQEPERSRTDPSAPRPNDDGSSIEHRYGRRTRQSLEDILDFAGEASELVSRGRDAYDSDRMLQLAAEAISNRIGEAVGRLSPELLRDHPHIPFRQAKGMRNFVSHHDDRIDANIVWDTLQAQVPPFAAQVLRLLRG